MSSRHGEGTEEVISTKVIEGDYLEQGRGNGKEKETQLPVIRYSRTTCPSAGQGWEMNAQNPPLPGGSIMDLRRSAGALQTD